MLARLEAEAAKPAADAKGGRATGGGVRAPRSDKVRLAQRFALLSTAMHPKGFVEEI